MSAEGLVALVLLGVGILVSFSSARRGTCPQTRAAKMPPEPADGPERVRAKLGIDDEPLKDKRRHLEARVMTLCGIITVAAIAAVAVVAVVSALRWVWRAGW